MSFPYNTASNANADVNATQAYSPVKVDLRAAIDASAGVEVFGPSEETLYNVVWCKVPMDVSALYVSDTRSLFEFWEPAGERETISASISADRNAKSVAEHFASELHRLLTSTLDASAANPFQAYPGTAYTQYGNFGELALSYAAEGMFGHPSATAAITNDEDIVLGFNNGTRKISDLLVEEKSNMGDQALAQRLASRLYTSNGQIATGIATSVLGQDARRMTNDDNSALQVDEKAALRFIPGDVVYVAITLKDFVSTVGGGNPGRQQYTVMTPTQQKYYLRIVLA